MQWEKVYPHKKLAVLGENTFQREVHEMQSLFREGRDHKDDVILPYIDMCLIT